MYVFLYYTGVLIEMNLKEFCMRFSWISDFCLKLLMGRASKWLHLFIGSLVFIGCTGVLLNGCIISATCTTVCRNALVKQGQKAYLNEDYTLSRQIFSQLALKQNDEQLQATGLYGRACMDMILAESAPAFRKAQATLLGLGSQLSYHASADRGRCAKTWSLIFPGMMEQALAHGVVLLESERSQILEKLNTLYARQEVYKKERLSMQKKINSLGPKITALKKQNMEQEVRITDLLHQITVLEKIDKERQEQRKNQ